MTSNDQQQYLTVEMFNSKMETFMTQMRLENEKLRSELRTEFQTGFATLQTQTQVNSAKIEMLQHTFYWGFAIMTLIIALVAIFVPYFLLNRKQKDKSEILSDQSISRAEVQDMISQALGGFKAAGK